MLSLYVNLTLGNNFHEIGFKLLSIIDHYTAENGRIYGKERKPVHPTRTGNIRDVEYTEMYGPVYS